jgi:hypothetical protein
MWSLTGQARRSPGVPAGRKITSRAAMLPVQNLRRVPGQPSYAEVVAGGPRCQDVSSDLLPMVSPSRRRKVRFNPSILVASFHFEWASARLIHLILSPWPKPRPSQSSSIPSLKLRRAAFGRRLHGQISQ